MKFCQHCGKEVVEDAVICVHCGRAISNQPAHVSGNDEVSVGLCILAFLIPLFGIIYWPVKHRETPKKAKACGITAIVSWALGILFYAIFYSVLLGMLM